MSSPFKIIMLESERKQDLMSRSSSSSELQMTSCPPEASCHRNIEDMAGLLTQANTRYDGERKARLHSDEKLTNMNRQYVSLNQQFNILREHNKLGDQSYRELDKSCKKLQNDLSLSQQECQNMKKQLESERERLNCRVDNVLETMRMLAQSLPSSSQDKAGYSEEEKQELKRECEDLKAVLTKEREMYSLKAFGPLQKRMPYWKGS